MAENVISTSSVDFDPFHPSNSVSVIIPVYNGAKFIAQTLNTILGQTVRPAEVIVVNDGSSDNTASIVEEHGDSITLISTPNGGVSAARNLGASRAKGNWLALCDGVVSDRSHLSYAPKDFWEPEQHNAGFVVREPITGKLTAFQPAGASVTLVRRDFYQSVGGFDVEANPWAEDTCFHFRCLSVVPFGVVPEVLMHYRRHPGSISADSLKQLRDTVLVWNHLIANYPQAQPYRAELLNGLVEMRKEVAETERYQRRQKLKRLLGLN
jgi:glycosyltransferase involved in cell wall biosynthesis